MADFFFKPTARQEDGFDPINQFQMLPVDRGCPLGALAPQFEDIVISSDNPAMAFIMLFAPIQGQVEVRGPNTFFLQKGSLPASLYSARRSV